MNAAKLVLHIYYAIVKLKVHVGKTLLLRRLSKTTSIQF